MFFGRWREDRDLERKADSYVGTLMREPADADVEWLARTATKGDADHARWELRYARRALGLIVAQRDALDDKTGSAVARVLADAMARDRSVDASTIEIAERQFNARMSAYRDGLDSRASGIPVTTRLGQTLFAFSGGAFRDAKDDVARGGELLTSYAAEANEALRAAFGTAQLPENVPPSAIR
ncbi:MAG TPA: hypothetical protein VFO55_03460 [Gemmatimonadaceae bacterium]|nr:hypothetical protein [Gemmatimonadaceae bacterium]